jgi:hypothetical protein
MRRAGKSGNFSKAHHGDSRRNVVRDVLHALDLEHTASNCRNTVKIPSLRAPDYQ